ncbi:MAG TPA: hypothetical protein VIK51_20995 [Vicinamibacteria bacterium]|jgi:hypothetical protein
MRADLLRAAARLAEGLLVLSLLRGVWLFATTDARAIAFPYPVDYAEGPLIDQVMRLSRFEGIYPPLSGHLPHTIANYPPVYPLLQVPLAWLFGPALWYGRALSLLGALATAALIARVLLVTTGDRFASLAAGATFLSLPYVVAWAALVRVDCVALALSWSGLALITPLAARRRSRFVAACLFVLAAFTRQSYVLAAPLAAFVWLVGQRRRAQAVELLLWVAGLGGLGLLALMGATGGAFWTHVVVANVNEFGWPRVANYAQDVAFRAPYLLLSAVWFLVLARRVPQATPWLVGPYLLGAAGSAILVGKVGSNLNYLLELGAALGLAAGAVLAAARNHPALRSVLALALAIQVASIHSWSAAQAAKLDSKTTRGTVVLDRLRRAVVESQGPVLADEYMALIPLEGRAVAYQPFEMKQLAQAGLWDERPFVEYLRQRRFAVILRDTRYMSARWTPAQLAAMDAHYEEVGHAAGSAILKPRP